MHDFVANSDKSSAAADTVQYHRKATVVLTLKLSYYAGVNTRIVSARGTVAASHSGLRPGQSGNTSPSHTVAILIECAICRPTTSSREIF